MAGSSTCLNAAVAEPLDVARGHPLPARRSPDRSRPRPGSTRPARRSPGWPDLLYGGRSGRPSGGRLRAARRRGGGRRRRARTASSRCRSSATASGPTRTCAAPSPGCRCATAGRRSARAVLEGVAFAIARPARPAPRRAARRSTELRVSGGDTRLATWNRIKADVLGIPVRTVPGDAAVDRRGDAGRPRRRGLPGPGRGDRALRPTSSRRSSRTRRTREPLRRGHARPTATLRPSAAGPARRPADEEADDARPARDQHLLRGQALAAAGGLGADRPRPARAAARPALVRPRRPAGSSTRPTPAAGRGSAARRRPRAPLDVHRARGLLGQPAPRTPMPAGRAAARGLVRRAIDLTAARGRAWPPAATSARSASPDWTDPDRRARALGGPAARRSTAWPARRAPAGLEYLMVENLAAAREPSTMAMIRDLLDRRRRRRASRSGSASTSGTCACPGRRGADRDPYAWLRELGPVGAGRPAPAVRRRRATTTGRSPPERNAAGPDRRRPGPRRARRGRRRGDRPDPRGDPAVRAGRRRRSLDDLVASVDYWREALVDAGRGADRTGGGLAAGLLGRLVPAHALADPGPGPPAERLRRRVDPASSAATWVVDVDTARRRTGGVAPRARRPRRRFRSTVWQKPQSAPRTARIRTRSIGAGEPSGPGRREPADRASGWSASRQAASPRSLLVRSPRSGAWSGAGRPGRASGRRSPSRSLEVERVGHRQPSMTTSTDQRPSGAA